MTRKTCLCLLGKRRWTGFACQGMGSGGLQGRPPRWVAGAAPGWTQTAPASSSGSTTGHRLAPQPRLGTSGKNVRKGIKFCTDRGGGNKKHEKQQREHQDQRRRMRWRRRATLDQMSTLQPMEDHFGAAIHTAAVVDPTLQQVDMPWGSCSPWKAHTGAEEEWGGKSGREEPSCTDCNPPFPLPLQCWQGRERERSQEWKNEVEPGKKGDGQSVLTLCFSPSTYIIISNKLN